MGSAGLLCFCISGKARICGWFRGQLDSCGDDMALRVKMASCMPHALPKELSNICYAYHKYHNYTTPLHGSPPPSAISSQGLAGLIASYFFIARIKAVPSGLHLFFLYPVLCLLM